MTGQQRPAAWTEEYAALRWLNALSDDDAPRPTKPRAGRVMAIASVLAFDLAWLDPDGVQCRPDISDLAECMAISERSVRACLGWLVDSGWFTASGEPTAYELTIPGER